MVQGATAVDGNTMYIIPGGSPHVWAFDLKEDKWTELPDCPQKGAGLAIITGLLTAVGGRTIDGDATNTLVSLTKSRSKWTEHFPPMPVELEYPAVVCMGEHLVAVGNMKRKVCVMDITLRWFTASRVPGPDLWIQSLAVCGTELYVVDSMRSVFNCSLPALLHSSVQTDKWKRLAKIPVFDITITTLCGQLVAVGGQLKAAWGHDDVELKQVHTIHLYNPSKDSWRSIRDIDMPTARQDCLVTTLPGDTLVVIGGYIKDGKPCGVVEVAYPVY